MTSDETIEEKNKCKDLGADLFLEKPITKEKLFNILKKLNFI